MNAKKFAVIESGGKQYLVAAGDKVQLDKLSADPGQTVKFDKVLLVADGDDVQVGKPYISGTAVEGKVVTQSRADKVLVMKYHSKTRYRRKHGHRQHVTEVEITRV